MMARTQFYSLEDYDTHGSRNETDPYGKKYTTEGERQGEGDIEATREDTGYCRGTGFARTREDR